MFNGQIIRELMDDRKEPYRNLMRALGVNPKNSNINSIVNGNPSVKRLEEIADYFDVPIDIFFIRKKQYKSPEITEYQKEIKDLKERIKYLETLMAEKDRCISVQETLIDTLRGENHRK